ncbi:MAG: RsmB/NOP family class I SAM-dependent RNA methyltransferase, partial [Spirochaetales bacterium]|nr:RsmB/NOP family class I SAM-dependent RNA methyltransferase [Spirochaetales bacterium]
MARREKLSGEQRFEQYYGEIYGQRWPVLKEALLRPTNPVSLSDRLVEPYYMDKASILAASILPISENNEVLDMCAAPGGKTLSIALRLSGKGSLVANDRSAARRNRLLTVIQSCLPEELRANIGLTGHDSTKWSLYEKNAYDR